MPIELARQLIREASEHQALDMDNSLLLAAIDQQLHSADFQLTDMSLPDAMEVVTRRFSYFSNDHLPRYSRLVDAGVEELLFINCQVYVLGVFFLSPV